MFSQNRRFLLVLFAMTSLGAANAFAVAAPTISVFSPTSGTLGATVTITGTNFVAPVTVSFGGAASAAVTVVSSTSVKAVVPATASTGTITVVASGASAVSASAFTVLPGVSLSAAVGPPTTSLTAYYSGFGSREPVDFYFDAEDIALGAASTGGVGNLALTIPADAHPGAHWITAVGRRSVTAVQIAFTVQTSWPQFGFTPNHKAKNHYENVLSAANVINLDQAWRTPYIGPVHDTPAIVNGIVYAAFNDGTIRAFNEITGAQQWSYKTGGLQMESSPDVANGIVYAGSDDDYLYALDAVIGALKWRYQTGGAVSCSPNAVNGIVYFGSLDEKLYALNATTGKLIWSFAAGGLVTPSPMVANGVVYVTADNGNLYALNAATGAQIWKSSTTGFSTTPMLVGGLIYIGSESGSMYALHSADGTEAWAYSTGQDAIASAPAAVGGAIFFGGENGSVYSLSTEGAFRWSTPLSTGGAIKSPVCVANGVVYASDGSYIYGLDQDTGAILATLPAGASPGGPVVVNGAVFTGDSYDDGLARYTLEGMSSNFVAPRPEPMQLRPHPLR